MGVLIESPALAQYLAGVWEKDLSRIAYELELKKSTDADPDTESDPYYIEWVSHEQGRQVRFRDDPSTTFWERFKRDILTIIPENLL